MGCQSKMLLLVLIFSSGFVYSNMETLAFYGFGTRGPPAFRPVYHIYIYIDCSVKHVGNTDHILYQTVDLPALRRGTLP